MLVLILSLLYIIPMCAFMITNSMIFSGIVSIVFSLRVDRLYDNKITWTDKYKDSETQEYQQLEHEAVRAVRVQQIPIVTRGYIILLFFTHNILHF